MTPPSPPTPPVLLVAFGRPDLLRQAMDAVREARPARLFIAVDGPRPGRADDDAATAACRALAEEVDWPCEVRTRFLPTNAGCKFGVSGAISWFFEQVEEGIILEEDCVPGPAFFPFCARLLELYRDEPKVGMISGDNFLPSAQWSAEGHAFTRFGFVWGWATWRRAWAKFDRDLEDWPARRGTGWLRRVHGTAELADYWRRIFDECHLGRRYDSWAFPWMYSLWKAEMVCAFPGANLVSNLGFDERGSHTNDASDTNAGVPKAPRHDPLPAPREIEVERGTEGVLAERFFKIRRRSWWSRAARTACVGAAGLAWAAPALVLGGGRAGGTARARALRWSHAGRPGESRACGRTWRFAEGGAFAEELERVWLRRRYDFRAEGEAPTIIDCGAGAGVAALYWRRRWPRARIVAYEPDPLQLECLRRNAGAAADAIEIRGEAVWREPGPVRFASAPDGRGHVVSDAVRREARHLIEVPAVTLEQVLTGEKVDLLKLSVGGAEHTLFADPGLLRPVQRVYVDCHLSLKRSEGPEHLLGFLRKAGFRTYLQTERQFSQRPFLRRGEEAGTLQRVQIYAYRA